MVLSTPSKGFTSGPCTAWLRGLRLEDVLDVFNAVDYRFSTKPRQAGKSKAGKFERFEENAQIGDELAMVALHYCYAKGLGTVDKDAEKAYRWAMRAYEVGHGAGKPALANCYAEGLGVGKNKAAAESMLRDSADFVLSKYALHEEMLGATPPHTGRGQGPP